VGWPEYTNILVTGASLFLLYDVSRTPVREAVLKLADEGLIEIFPQSGTFVARIPSGRILLGRVTPAA
jgi:DNA-binding GntR family transcriptional regulator